MPARGTAFFSARCTRSSYKWWRRSTQLLGSIEKVGDGNTKTHTFHQTHASAVKQSGDQRGFAVHLRQQPRHLVFGQYAGNAPFLSEAVNAVQPGQLNGENFPVKKQDRAQCLIVSRCRHLAVVGEMRQKCFNFACAPVERIPHRPATARPANEETNPVDVHLLDAEALVHIPNALAQLIQNPCGLQRRNAGFHRIFITGHISSILSGTSSCKPLSGGTHDQLMEQRPTYRAVFALDITLADKKAGML